MDTGLMKAGRSLQLLLAHQGINPQISAGVKMVIIGRTRERESMENQAPIAGESVFRRLLDYDLAGARRYDRFTTLMRVAPMGSHPEYLFLLKDVLRKTDRFFAYHGNHIVILMRETNSEGARVMTRRTQENCTDDIDLRFAMVTFPLDGKNAEELLTTLDRRFDMALRSGRGSVIAEG